MNKAFFVYVAHFPRARAFAVFAIWPELDLAGAHYFYHGGGFFGRNNFERLVRDFFRVTPFVVLTAYAAGLFGRSASGRQARWTPAAEPA